ETAGRKGPAPPVPRSGHGRGGAGPGWVGPPSWGSAADTWLNERPWRRLRPGRREIQVRSRGDPTCVDVARRHARGEGLIYGDGWVIMRLVSDAAGSVAW